MIAQAETMEHNIGGTEGFWSGTVDISRTPSPAARPAKRARQSLNDTELEAAPADLAQAWIEQGIVDDSWLEIGDSGLESAWQESDAMDFGVLMGDFPATTTTTTTTGTSPFGYATQLERFRDVFLRSGSLEKLERKTRMQTGCIPCLIKGRPCDPRNPECKRAISSDWNLNYKRDKDDDGEPYSYPTPESMALSTYRPDMIWRRNWRERHSLNFFVNFTAPQMAGFFDSTFWQQTVIQTSYHEPAILHAVTAIGALHEAIMQRAFADEKRKAQAMEFALTQCNKAISSLAGAKANDSRKVPDNRLALTTCVLFTCFEAMQGRCDSAVNHALQGRRLLQASGRGDTNGFAPLDQDDMEQMRPLVERLEVQATALLDKGKRPDTDTSDRVMPLPPVDFIFSLDHAHNTLHTALNSIMRFMQGFHPTAPRDHIVVSMAEKYLRYAPWFQQWENGFTSFLGDNREFMTNMDFKRAMVLKANHLVGTMLASVDQSAGPVAYDAYESEFKAIVDLSRVVLAAFSCPPLPTLSGGATGTPYLSFSLWVTDPLWMAISRCRNPSIRQAAFTLLSQNPRQEGIWHAGPQLSNNRYMRRVEAASASRLKETVKGDLPPKNPPKPAAATYDAESDDDDDDEEEAEEAQCTNDTHAASAAENGRQVLFAEAKGGHARREWVDLRAQIQQWTKRT